jgi:hypothetical protein
VLDSENLRVSFFWWDWGWTQGFVLCRLSHTSSDSCSGYFGGGVLRIICPGWPRTTVLLISASQVARTTGVSHWHPARFSVLRLLILKSPWSRCERIGFGKCPPLKKNPKDTPV